MREGKPATWPLGEALAGLEAAQGAIRGYFLELDESDDGKMVLRRGGSSSHGVSF